MLAAEIVCLSIEGGVTQTEKQYHSRFQYCSTTDLGLYLARS